MKGFYDIEGTEICVNDEVLVTLRDGSSTAPMVKAKVTEIKKRKIYFRNHEENTWASSMLDYGCPDRILILKGEFKKYTKTEIKTDNEQTN